MEKFLTVTDRWLAVIAGSTKTTELRHRVLNAVIFIGLFGAGYFVVADAILNPSWLQLATDVVLVFLCLGCYYFVRIRRMFRNTLHFVTILILLYYCVNFFVNSGIHGPTLLVVEFLMTCIAFLHRPQSAAIYTGIGVFLALACVVVGFFSPDSVKYYPTPIDQVLDIMETFLVCILMTYVVMRMINRFFDDTLVLKQSIQAASLQTEKMVALGELSATLLHELNSPLALVAAALSESAAWWVNVMPTMPKILASLNLAQTAAFWQILDQGLVSLGQPRLDSRTRRLHRAELAVDFERRGFGDPSSWAEDALDRGVTQWSSAWDALSINEAGREGLKFAFELLTVQSATTSSLRAWEKVDNLLDAVRSFSRTDKQDALPEPVDLQESVETVLTLYASYREIEVIRDFSPVPPILAHPDQLIQVWTNIVKNAVQAMNMKGTLTVQIFQKAEDITVMITDSGPGLPSGDSEKVFETFFTTKPRKQGTGLGLSVVQRTVEAHGGSVTAENAPEGGARFIVRLPAVQPSPPLISLET